jgi:hypothetical protein
METPALSVTESLDTSFDTAAGQPTQDVGAARAILRQAQDAAQDAAQNGSGSVVERALAELGIEWKNVMAFGVHSDRVVIIEGPVGYKRTYMLPDAGEAGERAEPA